MTGRTWKISCLVVMSLVGVILGIWVTRLGFIGLGSLFIGVFLWRAQQFSLWLIVPNRVPSDVASPLISSWQRLLLSIVCLLGAGLCMIEVYLWRLWSEEWQAGL